VGYRSLVHGEHAGNNHGGLLILRR
jgi:hypothetical protein